MKPIARVLVGAALAAASGIFVGRSIFELQVKAQEDLVLTPVTLGFEETFYLVDPDGAIVDLKRRVKTRYFDGNRISSTWKRGDLEFRMVGGAPDDTGVSSRTVVISGDSFPTQHSTFASQGSDASKAALRASLCGLRGAPTKEILGFTTYQEVRSTPPDEYGTVTVEQWVAPALTCVPLQSRAWRETADGRQFTLTSMEPLFRKDGVAEGAFALPTDSQEMLPSELEKSALARIVPHIAQDRGELQVGESFQRLDQRYREDQAVLAGRERDRE